MGELLLTSEAFAHRGRIPDRHARASENRSPPLAWSGLPEGTRSIAIVCDDPDAPSGTFVHWLGWGISPAAAGLREGEPAPKQGRNGFGGDGYDGPAPPPGHGPHRYFFRVYALDSEPELEPGASRDQLERAIEGHVLAGGEHMGTYER